MNYEIATTIIFCVLVLIACRVWGIHVVRQYEKKKVIKSTEKLTPEYDLCEIDHLALAGTGDDGNSDYGFSQAAAKIELSETSRVQIHE